MVANETADGREAWGSAGCLVSWRHGGLGEPTSHIAAALDCPRTRSMARVLRGCCRQGWDLHLCRQDMGMATHMSACLFHMCRELQAWGELAEKALPASPVPSCHEEPNLAPASRRCTRRGCFSLLFMEPAIWPSFITRLQQFV